MKTAGILLAGGQSRRFGSDKAFALHGGKPFYEYSYEALQPFCDEIIVAARAEFAARFPAGYFVIEDNEMYAGQGPLAGILSAMEALEADRYIVLPCDMPFIRPDMIGSLLARHTGGVAAVEFDGARHPLISVWHADVKPAIRQALDSGSRRVMSVAYGAEFYWIDGRMLAEDAELQLKNVNTPYELERR